MRILILRQTAINGQAVRPGDVVDADEADARILVLMRKAEPAQDLDPVIVPDPVTEPVAEPRKPRSRKR
jgi:hypothetical protein